MDTLRISERGKAQLLRLRRLTGIKQWNVLCRWALCTSLADGRSVGDIRVVGDSNVEISWKVLTGAWSDAYLLLLTNRCEEEGTPPTEKALNQLLRRHVHRGIGILSADPTLVDVASLHDRVG